MADRDNLFRRQTREVLAFARLTGGHHDADDLSVPFADGEKPHGYFILDPSSVVFLGKPIPRCELPWKTGRTSPANPERPLDLGLLWQAWYLETNQGQEDAFFALVDRNQPKRPALTSLDCRGE